MSDFVSDTVTGIADGVHGILNYVDDSVELWTWLSSVSSPQAQALLSFGGRLDALFCLQQVAPMRIPVRH